MVTIEQLKALNDLELDIYNYLEENKEQIINMKLKDIASLIHVSPSAITRCIKKLGYSGFSEFKLEYKLSKPEKSKTKQRTLEYLIDYFHKIDTKQFDLNVKKAMEIIEKCDDILFFGLGLSGALAKYGAYLFNRNGIRAFHLDDFSMRVKDIYDEKTCAIVLSVSGQTPEVYRQVIALKNCKVKIILITNTASSSLASISDFSLCYYVPSERDEFFYSSATQVPVVYILETLCDELVNN